MSRSMLIASVCGLTLCAQVPPYRVPSAYLSATEIEAGLNKIDPKLVASQTGGSVPVGQGYNVVVRRRVTGPQYAITHTRDLEYLVITKGTATLVTGGTLIPPIIPSDSYPIKEPNAIVRSAAGVKGGQAREIGPGDVVVTPPGTPHWLSKINGTIEYVEIRIPNVDPAPGVERAEMAHAQIAHE
jgi:mannose-6-phosphate isomerase-like protein (cupin superfamily)